MVRSRTLLLQSATVFSVLVAVYGLLIAFKLAGSEVNFDRQFVVNGIGNGIIYGSLALALVLIYRSTDVVNFAQGEISMFCTFVGWSLITQVGMNFWVGFGATLIFAALFGAGIQRVVIAPIERAPLLTLIIVTLGLFVAVNSFANFIWQAEPKLFPTPFGRGAVHFAGMSLGKPYVGALGLMFVVMALVFCFFNYTKLGLACRAAAQNPVASRLCGVPVGWMLTIGWALAAIVGAAAGMLIANLLGLSPSLMQGVLLYAFAAAVLGGLDNPVGAVVGGFLIGIIQSVIQGSDFLKGIPDPVAFIVIVLVLVVRPAGLLGRQTLKKV